MYMTSNGNQTQTFIDLESRTLSTLLHAPTRSLERNSRCLLLRTTQVDHEVSVSNVTRYPLDLGNLAGLFLRLCRKTST